MLLNVRSDEANADETLLSLRFGKKVSQCDTSHAGSAKHAAGAAKFRANRPALASVRHLANTQRAVDPRVE